MQSKSFLTRFPALDRSRAGGDPTRCAGTIRENDPSKQENGVTPLVLVWFIALLLTLALAPTSADAGLIGSADRASAMEPVRRESGNGQERPFEIQGHRGAGELAPENSIAAFKKAIALGVDTLEMDVQSTRDRVLVVYHDQKIDTARCRRIDGGKLGSKLIKDLSFNELMAIRCDEGAGIPKLEEALRLARAAPYSVRANVEIKMQKLSRGISVEEIAALLVEVIDATGMRGRTLVQSFDAEALRSMRRIAPDIPRAVLSRDRDSFLALVAETTASALLPRRDRLEQMDVEALHTQGVVVIPWVVDEPEEMARLRAWGVDGIITNRPDVALEFRDGSVRRLTDAESNSPPPTPWPPPVPPVPSSANPTPGAPQAASRAFTIGDIRKVAVFYFTSDGNTDTYLTSLFLEEFRKRHSQEPIDPLELADQPRDGERYHPAGKLDALFEEAGRHSAQAIILGIGKWYRPGALGRGFRLEVRLIEIREGKVLWQATAASGGTFSGPPAKREVVRKVLRSYPGILKR